MMKKLGVRWMPGLPFIDEPRVSMTFGRNDELFVPAAGTALVLVLAQEPRSPGQAQGDNHEA